ncbi:TIGR03364 family FAD-dependent oxidoreductase [Antrihabitans cavernicola]|uniref:TIGR03364 family FAD-dependent oxidoreductase n=1 Tax=Antrihabitans cavernicola TaxID=2495913 RepID=A0A5A7SAT2_9NOCA|nr:TIGR03364 family FAD-dependent oxidoreductase [Spelaeibacter cavernicola]KAA0023260.1 TIGR03364 family FAD-dependent oxidoreductase [Spelaeibacter cavernicola]
MQVVVIGGGILGTAHAREAIRRGHDVVQLEREPEARGATVRNFGLVWVSGRAPHELAASLRSRELWEQIGREVPGVGFRPAGSLTLLRTPDEVAVAEEVLARPDATERGFTLLDPTAVLAINPALRGKYVAGLHCSRDGAVESRVALPAIRAALAASVRYTFHAGTEAREVRSTSSGAVVRDDHNREHPADLVLICPGAALTGLARELAGELPIRRVRLQMMQTAPLDEQLTTAIADGDSLRYYPAFAGSELDTLRTNQPQDPVAAQHKMQLLCVQRLHGGLTIGDTHEYTEPFAFDVDEAPYAYLTGVVEELLGRTLPPIVRRWAGVYSQCVDPTELVHRHRVDDHTWVIAGPGGRGMTLGPVLGEQTADQLDL